MTKRRKKPVRRKPVRKVSAKNKVATPTGEEIFKNLVELFPVIVDTDQFRMKSWRMFADQLAKAYAQGTMLFCVTVNPDILHNKEAIQAKFPCQVVSPTEALAAGGFDFIQ